MRPGMVPGLYGCVLDGTPILLCPCGDLHRIRGKAVKITAVITVQPFKGVQVFQVMAVEDDMITTSDFWNPVNRKTDCLIYP